jgi:peptidoglycan-N-acetylglucosamine deacetylase
MAYDDKTYVVLTFDIDGETLWTSRDKVNKIGPVMRSQGRYGPEVGLPRILGLLKCFNLPATFFVTGQVADRYPDQCRLILDQGHEIGHHNYHHEWPCKVEPEVERRDFEKGLEAIRRLTGKTPAGYRAPGWEFSELTFKLLVEHGLQYSSNMMDDEKPYEYTIGGEPTGIVELPCSWILDDAAFSLRAEPLPIEVCAMNHKQLKIPVCSIGARWKVGGPLMICSDDFLKNMAEEHILINRTQIPNGE